MKKNKLNRQDFLKVAGIALAGLGLSACSADATTLPAPTAASSLTPVPVKTNTPTSTPLPASTNTPTLSPTPKPPTMGELARKLGFDIGISLRLVDDFNNPRYQDFLLNFSMLTDGWASNPVQFVDSKQSGWGSKKFTMDYLNMLSAFCKSHNMSFDLNHLYYGFGYFKKSSPVYYLNNASKDEIVAWYHDRVKMFFEIPYFTSANFVNEAISNNPTNLRYNWGMDKILSTIFMARIIHTKVIKLPGMKL